MPLVEALVATLPLPQLPLPRRSTKTRDALPTRQFEGLREESRLLGSINKRFARLIIYFVLFIACIILGIWLCSQFGVSPVAGGLVLLALIVALMVGEFLPERFEHLRMWYYMMLVALGMILFGLVKSGVLPFSALALVPLEANNTLSLALMEVSIIIIVASLLFYIFLRILAKKLKPKMGATTATAHTSYTRKVKEREAVAYA